MKTTVAADVEIMIGNHETFGISGLKVPRCQNNLYCSPIEVIWYDNYCHSLVLDHGLVVIGPVGMVAVGGGYVDFTQGVAKFVGGSVV